MRAVLILSIIANLVLAALLFTGGGKKSTRGPQTSQVRTQEVVKQIVKPVVSREKFEWSQVENGDYTIYIANLRKIGCPQATIRDIIVADVNALYAKKRSDQADNRDQWWRTSPDMDAPDREADSSAALDRERRQLLSQLLGANWEQPDATSPAGRRGTVGGMNLNGVGQLSPQIEASLTQSWMRYQTARRTARTAADNFKAAQTFRAEAASVLTPAQLEEFMLRNSQTSQTIRQQFSALTLTPDEFRSIYRVRAGIEQQLSAADYTADPAAAARRAAIENSADGMIGQILGPERFAQYKASRGQTVTPQPSVDTAADTRAVAVAEAKAAENNRKVAEIDAAAKAEMQRLISDNTLTAEQKAAAVEGVYDEEKKAVRQILGEEAYKKWEATLGK